MKNANVVIEVKENFDSLESMAQNQARLSDVLANHARYAMKTIVGFPESAPSKEQMAQLNNGYAKTFMDSNPNRTYARIGETLVEFETLTPEQQKGVKEKLVIGLEYAMALSPQKFAKMRTGKDSDPSQHAILKVIRDKFSDYKGAKYKNLVAKCKELLPKAKRERNATEDFIVRLTPFFDAMEKTCKIAVGKGDETADVKKFIQAKIKFMTEYKKM
jgi:hypothetical protein